MCLDMLVQLLFPEAPRGESPREESCAATLIIVPSSQARGHPLPEVREPQNSFSVSRAHCYLTNILTLEHT